MNGSNLLAIATPPSTYLAFQATFMALIMTLTILGNIAVCYVVYRTKSIATVTGMSITSLAVADLLRGSVVLPFAIMTSILGATWPFGYGLCSAAGFFHTMLGSASVMTLGAVSLDRYIAILKPLKYATIVTTIRAAVLLVTIWSLSSLIAILPLIGWSSYIFIPWTCICVVDWRPGYSSGYAFFYLSLAFLLPFMVLISCYYRIFIVARKQSRRVMAMEVASMDNNTLQRNKGSGGQSRTHRFTSMRKEKKAALTLFIVIGIFISCVTPYCIVYLIASYNPTPRALAAMGVTSMLSFLNSAANPIIYGILNRKFRRMFLHVITCKRCKPVNENPAALQSNNGTASTAMAMRKRNLRREDTAKNIAKHEETAKGLLKLSVAATGGSTMACVLDDNAVNGLEKLTVNHLPTISDVREPPEGKHLGGPRKPDNDQNVKVRTIAIQASIDPNCKHRDREKCDVIVLARPICL